MQQKSFELVQAWMAVFLKVHGESIVSAAEDGSGGEEEEEEEGGGLGLGLREALQEWRGEQEREGRRLADLAGFCGGVVGFLRCGR